MPNPPRPSATEFVDPPEPATPPPLPGAMARLAEDYHPLEGGVRLASVMDALLKRPASLAYEFVHGRAADVALRLLVLDVLCLLVYGLVMGSFSGGQQYWAVPLKFLGGSLLSAALCLPSLYIFGCLDGGRQSFPQTAGLLLLVLALSGLLLLGFAPIAWVFSQSTGALGFMGTLHLAFWITAAGFGYQLLARASAFLNRRRSGVLGLWAIIFVAVNLQMSTALRPLIGKPDHDHLTPAKKFFLSHWSDSISK